MEYEYPLLVVYGKENCPRCDKLKKQLELDNINYFYYTLGKEYTMEFLMSIKPADVKSFPVPIVHDKNMTSGKYISPDACNIKNEYIAWNFVD